MEISALKLRLIQLILETDNQEVLLKILEVLEDNQKNYDTALEAGLSPEQISELDRRLQELENGEVELYDADEFMQELQSEIKEKRRKNMNNKRKNRIIDDAKQDTREAQEYYESISEKLGDSFVELNRATASKNFLKIKSLIINTLNFSKSQKTEIFKTLTH